MLICIFFIIISVCIIAVFFFHGWAQINLAVWPKSVSWKVYGQNKKNCSSFISKTNLKH